MHKLMNIIKDAGAIRAYEFREFFGINKPINELDRNVSGGFDKPDARYNVPKESPKASEELISKTIEDTEIYRLAKGHILNAQRKQVAYGIDKYPEPLNADTWSTIETIDHIIDESIDKLHYLVMLRVKLEREADLNSKSTEEELPSDDAICQALESDMNTILEKGIRELTEEVPEEILTLYADGHEYKVGVDINKEENKKLWNDKRGM